MIREYEFYHGIVFTRLFKASTLPLQVGSYPLGSNAAYFLRSGNTSTGIYIKHCTKRLSPWSYTFVREHQDEIDKMKADLGEVFLALVCGEDGIVVLSYDELKSLLDHHHEPTEWIRVSRGKRQMYSVKGKDGSLDFKVGESDFPRKILDYITPTSTPSGELQNDLRLHALA